MCASSDVVKIYRIAALFEWIIVFPQVNGKFPLTPKMTKMHCKRGRAIVSRACSCASCFVSKDSVLRDGQL